MLKAVSSWLFRSGTLPLSISLFSPIHRSDPSAPSNRHVRPFLDLLAPFASRWKSISFRIENYDWTEFFNRFSAEEVPLLEKIHIGGTQVARRISGDSETPDFVAATRDHGILCAPLLRSVSIPRYAAQTLQLPVKWGELVELSLTNGTFALQDILEALTLCPNLVNCSISLSNWNSMVIDDDSYAPPRVVLPKLKMLSLEDDIAQYDMPALLRSLVVPQLCHLSFRRGMNWGGSTYSALQPLIRAFSAFIRCLIDPLQELELEVNSMPEDCVMQILELLPGLKRLSLESYGKAETTLDGTPYAWDTPYSFYFTDEPLRRLIPKVITIQVQSSDQVNPDRPLDERASDSDSESAASALDVPLASLFNSSPSVSGSERKTVINQLCPDLEVFRCTGGMFSELTLLEFLRARSLRHHELGVAHLRRVGVSFVPGRQQSTSFTEQISKLAELVGMSVYLNYSKSLFVLPPHPDSVYSPYQGINDEGDHSYPPVHFGF
ncbi:hypothetical protein AN958_01022 [Leucoagaricus sp. SymC.cos]|nr:hypothetical protein AN958_01022 [Leucoagaricus sp. SymC.cos]